MLHLPTPPAVEQATHLEALLPRRLIGLVAAFGVGIAAAVAGATAASLYSARTQALEAAQETSRNLTRAVTDAVARSIQSVDVTLASVADQVAESGLERGDDALEDSLRQRLAFTPNLRQIVVTDRTGTIRHDSAPQGRGLSMDVAPLLAAHARAIRPLEIGKPMAGRFLGRPAMGGQSYIPLSRAIAGKDGVPMALAVAAVNPQQFQAMFDAMELHPDARVGVWLFDGTLLIGHFSGANEPLFAGPLKASEFGTYTAIDPDGIARITSYRMTHAWPLVVSVGLPVDAVLASWHDSVLKIGAPVAAVTLVVLLLTGVLVRSLVRRARDEAALRLSDRVLATISNGVAIADATQPDQPLVYVNPAFERITGYEAAQVLGRNARFLHAQDVDQPALETVRRALAEGQSVNAVLRNFRADGSPFWNDLSLSAVRDSHGAITHYVAVQRDITEQEESREKLKSAYDHIARYSKDLERFSFVLAHHLQEPARQIGIYAQLLQRELALPDTDESSQRLAYMVAASTRLRELLRDVQLYLALDRLGVGGQRTSAEKCFIEAMARISQNRGLSPLPLTVVRQPLPDVTLDAKRLVDLFAVLIDNAIEYRHPDRPPVLRIETGEQDGMTAFSFTDNGIGIDPAYHERVFTVFERLHPREEHGGTGIGLSIARKIVEMVGGTIKLRSDGTTGTSVVFTLPHPQE